VVAAPRTEVRGIGQGNRGGLPLHGEEDAAGIRGSPKASAGHEATIAGCRGQDSRAERELEGVGGTPGVVSA
jgi:hypothetical protein